MPDLDLMCARFARRVEPTDWQRGMVVSIYPDSSRFPKVADGITYTIVRVEDAVLEDLGRYLEIHATDPLNPVPTMIALRRYVIDLDALEQEQSNPTGKGRRIDRTGRGDKARWLARPTRGDDIRIDEPLHFVVTVQELIDLTIDVTERGLPAVRMRPTGRGRDDRGR